MKDMKIFFWKLLLLQTLIYGLMFIAAYYDEIISDSGLRWQLFILTFYSMSVICTFIIPMIKIYRNK